MVSKKYKTIFIHIQKTAGTSIETKLGHFNKANNQQDHRTIIDLELLFDKKRILKKALSNYKNGEFNKANNILSKFIVPELTCNQYQSFFKFSFVRNSWSRMYSWYAAIMADERQRGYYNLAKENTFKEFLLKIKHPKFSQMNFLFNRNGKIPLDFIGRFENLEQDFSFVCDSIGIMDPKLPKILVRGNKHYSNFYDDETKDIIYKNYQKEIKYFNFEYGE